MDQKNYNDKNWCDDETHRLNNEIHRLECRIRELSKPCNRLFGWMPVKISMPVGYLIVILILIASANIACAFKDLVFEVFSLSYWGCQELGIFCIVIGFIISFWFLTQGFMRIDEKASEKINAKNKREIDGIKAMIELLENKRHEIWAIYKKSLFD